MKQIFILREKSVQKMNKKIVQFSVTSQITLQGVSIRDWAVRSDVFTLCQLSYKLQAEIPRQTDEVFLPSRHCTFSLFFLSQTVATISINLEFRP